MTRSIRQTKRFGVHVLGADSPARNLAIRMINSSGTASESGKRIVPLLILVARAIDFERCHRATGHAEPVEARAMPPHLRHADLVHWSAL